MNLNPFIKRFATKIVKENPDMHEDLQNETILLFTHLEEQFTDWVNKLRTKNNYMDGIEKVAKKLGYSTLWNDEKTELHIYDNNSYGDESLSDFNVLTDAIDQEIYNILNS